MATNTDTDGPLCISIKQAAQLTGICRSTLYEALNRGELPARKLGKRTVILLADLEAFLASLPDYPQTGKEV